jgi:sec-independent protein translocase protein TatB
MFDLSWSHIGLLLVVALIVLGPKELPNAIRTGAQLLRQARKMAGEFRSGVDELVREAELDETRRSIQTAMAEGMDNTIAKTVDPTGEIKGALEGDPLAETSQPEMQGPGNLIVNDPPPAPSDSVVPPPPETPMPEAPPEPAGEVAAPMPGETTPGSESADLKKSA